MELSVSKSPTDELSLTNCLILHPDDCKRLDPKFDFGSSDGGQSKKTYIQVLVPSENNGITFVYTIKDSPKMKQGFVGLSFIQRKWIIGSRLEFPLRLSPHKFDPQRNILASITLVADFLQKSKTSKDPYNTDKMVLDFKEMFISLPFTIGQEFIFKFENKPMLLLKVKSLQVLDPATLSGGSIGALKANIGLLHGNSQVVFDKSEASILNLSGKARGKTAMPTIINPDWDFSKMGIGGLDKEFSAIFRRAFASRVFPAEVVEQLGLHHVKGILLYGPPGTGKTLMARQIGKMLSAREPKIVNGPEILNKYVGESEANIRKLFEEAEQDQQKLGANSGLHMIILDEIDAICKSRGSVTGSTGVSDTVVNQLLSKIDGVEQLNNILIIGMTNRKDLIDEALLRPGRLEVQMEISLPSEEGRFQILNIHTEKLREHKKLAQDVNLEELAAETKNFSGAEIEGLVRAATTTAMNKLIKASGKVVVSEDAVEKLEVQKIDFRHALDYDIKPAFGAASDDSEHYIGNGVFTYGQPVEKVVGDGQLLIDQTKNGSLISPVSALLEGKVGSGKTALAARIAYQMSDFPFVKVVSPENMIGFSESAKCQAIKKIFDDAYKSELSCVIVDDIERLIDYVPIGPRFSNIVLQTLIVLLKKKLRHGRKLLIIGTTSCYDVIKQMQMASCFNTVINVPNITNPMYIINILNDLERFLDEELNELENYFKNKNVNISVKKLLGFVEMSVQTGRNNRLPKLISLLEEQNHVTLLKKDKQEEYFEDDEE